MASDTVVLFNTGKRGTVDVHFPDSGREHEMLVRRKKRSEDGIGDEVVAQLVRVKRPHSKCLRKGEQVILPSSVLQDPIIASQLREGVLGYRFRKATPRTAKAEEKAAPVEEKKADTGKGKGAKGKTSGKSGGKE